MEQDFQEYKLSNDLHKRILNKEIADLRDSSVLSSHPTILIISGQPGCGKTAMTEQLKEKLFEEPSKVAVINGDDYRALHPKSMDIFKAKGKDYAKYTDPDARVWTSELLEWASNNKRDIIFESTLRKAEPINTTIKQLKEKGYKIYVAVMAVPFEISRTNIVLRYQDGLQRKNSIARWTDFSSHDEAYKNIPDTAGYLEKNNHSIDKMLVFAWEGYKKPPMLIYPDKEFQGIKEAIITGRAKELQQDEKLMFQLKQSKALNFLDQSKAHRELKEYCKDTKELGIYERSNKEIQNER